MTFDSLDFDLGAIDESNIVNEFDKFCFHIRVELQFVGYFVSNWKRVIATVQEMARIVPQVQYA